MQRKKAQLGYRVVSLYLTPFPLEWCGGADNSRVLKKGCIP